MDRYVIWPSQGTGADLARALSEAAIDGTNRLSASPADMLQAYLNLVADHVTTLRTRVSAGDLDLLLTSPRYWATFANPIPVPSTVSAVIEEVRYRAGLMNEAANALTEAALAWRPVDREYTNLVVVDTNFWVEREGSFDSIDWHELINAADGPSAPASRMNYAW